MVGVSELGVAAVELTDVGVVGLDMGCIGVVDEFRSPCSIVTGLAVDASPV